MKITSTLSVFVIHISVLSHAAEVEQAEDMFVHMTLGATANHPAAMNVGHGADGGDYAGLIKWEESALASAVHGVARFEAAGLDGITEVTGAINY